MKFSHTVKLVLTNFSNVWKLLLYYTICTVIGVLALYVVVNPIAEVLSEARVFEDLMAFFNAIFKEPAGVVKSFDDILITIEQVISVNSADLMLNYIFTILLVFVILPFMFGLSDLAIGEVLYGYMTSQTPYSFTGSYFRKFGKSVKYSLAKLPTHIVQEVIGILLLIGGVKLFVMGSWYGILLGLLVFVVDIIFYVFKVTIFTCWMPAIAVNNTGIYKSMGIGIKAVFRNFFSTFSNALILVLCAVVVNFFFAVFTFVVGLVVTLPLTIYAFMVYGMVAYFSNQGMRFYVYPDMFVTPKRIKEQETIKRLRFHI